MTVDGTMCIYDNGNYQARPFDPPNQPAQGFSRGVEYHVDEAAGTVEEVWSSADEDTADKVISWAVY